MITISGDDAPGDTTNQITQVIQTVLAAQLVNNSLGQPSPPANGAAPRQDRPVSEEKRAPVDFGALTPRKG